MDNRNLVELLKSRSEKHPDQVAIIEKNHSVTYFELYRRVQTTSDFLVSKGLKPGDRLLVFIPMSIRLYEILLAIFYSGMTAVFADAWTTKHRLSELTIFLKPTVFWGIPKAHLLRLINSDIRHIPFHFFPGSGTSTNKLNSVMKPPEEQIPALITLTSGSTGFPKAAKRTHEFLLSQHEVLKKLLALSEGDIDMPTLPVFVLNNLACGITTLLPDMNLLKPEQTNPKRILNQWETYKPNSVTGSPIFFHLISDYILLQKIRSFLPSKIFVGGAPVFPSLARKLKKSFPHSEISIVYGSTEAEPISEIFIDEFLSKSNIINPQGLCVGKPVNEIDVLILPISDLPIQVELEEILVSLQLPPKEIGEIVVKGQHVLTAYVNQPEEELKSKIKTQTAIWHRTGDAGLMDSDGNLWLVGRTSSLIKYADKILFPFPIEIMLSEMEEIKISTVVSFGNKLWIVCELHPSANFDMIKPKIESLISGYLPTKPEIIHIQKMPVDPRHNSKIDSAKLVEILKKL